MIEGNINLKQFDNFHLELDYEVPPEPTVGFNYLYLEDAERYINENITAHIARKLPLELENYINTCFEKLSYIKLSVQKMLPGMILPYHTDKYGFYLSQHKEYSITNVKRIIVFLEDWKPGHISEVNDQSHTNWRAGDWISWQGSTKHMAANIGYNNRYTLQITGIII